MPFVSAYSQRKRDLLRGLLKLLLGSLTVNLLVSFLQCLRIRKMLLGDMVLDPLCFSTSALFLRILASGWLLLSSPSLMILLFKGRLSR